MDIKIPQGFFTDLSRAFTGITTIVIAIAALLVFYELIMAGLNWITSGGDRGKTESARNRIVAALVGMLLVSASYAVLLLMLQFLGFDSLADVFNEVKTIR